MSFQDRSIRCSDCGSAFIFSAEKQEFFQAWGRDSEQKRCPSCAQAAKRYGTGNYGSNRRQMFRVTCAECGKDTEVPFEPRAYRRVYCSDCYRKVRVHR